MKYDCTSTLSASYIGSAKHFYFWKHTKYEGLSEPRDQGSLGVTFQERSISLLMLDLRALLVAEVCTANPQIPLDFLLKARSASTSSCGGIRRPERSETRWGLGGHPPGTVVFLPKS
jgi:hypothetical protein